MKLLNVKSISALALSAVLATAAFARYEVDAPYDADLIVAKPSPTLPAYFLKDDLKAQKLNQAQHVHQAQEEDTFSYRKMILENGVAAAKYCGQKVIDVTENIIEFGPVKYAVNMAGAYIAVDALGTPFIDLTLDALGAAAVPVVGPAGPAVASGLKFINKAADWIPGVHEAKNVLIAAAVKDVVVPGAIGAAKLVYNNAGTVYKGAAKAASYLANWWNSTAKLI